MNHSKKCSPAIRIKGFTDDWEQRKLGEVADIIGGGTPSTTNPDYWNGEVDWYSPTEIGERIYVDNSLKKLTTLGLKHSSAKLLPANKTILFTSRASIGDMAILMKQGATNQGFQSLVVNDYINVYFLFSLGNKIKEFAVKNSSGSTFLEISKNKLAQMNLKIPSLEEQTQIGSFFKQLDETIALHKRTLEKHQNLKKFYLEKMFPKENQQFPEIRFPNFTDAWEQRKLGEIAQFSKGQGYSKSDLSSSGYPIILYGSLYTDYKTVIESTNTFVKEDINSIKSIGNEVIVPASGETPEDIARASAVLRKEIILGGDLNIIRPFLSKLEPIFLALSISNGTVKTELSKKAQGKSVVHIRNSDLQNIIINYPRVKEQTQIGNFFKQLDETIALHKTKTEKISANQSHLFSKNVRGYRHVPLPSRTFLPK